MSFGTLKQRKAAIEHWQTVKLTSWFYDLNLATNCWDIPTVLQMLRAKTVRLT
jgi:hypothetical protein